MYSSAAKPFDSSPAKAVIHYVSRKKGKQLAWFIHQYNYTNMHIYINV